jgi:hypothetical protein
VPVNLRFEVLFFFVAAVHVSLNGDDSHEWVRSGNGIVNSPRHGSDTVNMNHPVPWFAHTIIQWKSSMIHQDLCLVQPETEYNTARLHGGVCTDPDTASQTHSIYSRYKSIEIPLHCSISHYCL